MKWQKCLKNKQQSRSLNPKIGWIAEKLQNVKTGYG
jgi:hypothetical protein